MIYCNIIKPKGVICSSIPREIENVNRNASLQTSVMFGCLMIFVFMKFLALVFMEQEFGFFG